MVGLFDYLVYEDLAARLRESGIVGESEKPMRLTCAFMDRQAAQRWIDGETARSGRTYVIRPNRDRS